MKTPGRRASALLAPLALALLVLADVAPCPAARQSSAERCARTKLKAAGQAMATLIRCRSSGAASAAGMQASCVERAHRQLARSFERAERRGGCATKGDAAAVESTIQQFVAALAARFTAPPATPSPSPSPTESPTPSPTATASPAASATGATPAASPPP